MRRNYKKYQEELLERLSKSPDLKKERMLFRQISKHPILWIAEGANLGGILPINGKLACSKARQFKIKGRLKCLKETLSQARRSRSIEKFICPGQGYGLCLPLVHGEALYGFLVLCNLETPPTEESLRLFEALNSTILEKIQKELELSKLYQTIRPRAIALSTVHTIHRLISSSLNLDELLPRIARLSLQVLRAKGCLISLLDKKSKRLVPKAALDLSNKRSRLRTLHNMKRVENRVMHSSKTLLRKSYLSVPLIDEELIGVITVFHKIMDRAFDNFDQEILSALSEQAVGAIRNAQLYKEQQDLLFGTVKSLSTLLKAKSTQTYTHSKAFVDIALGIGRELRLSEEDLRNLRFAAMLHDAERIGIPEEILKKPAHLTGKEFKIIKGLPKKSAEILSPLQVLKPAIAIILHHHEKFDGTGYPDRLKGEEIPLGARIMAVADSFEAMISRRPYRKSTSIPEAINEIKKYSGAQFDPQVIKAFLKLSKEKGFKKLVRGARYG